MRRKNGLEKRRVLDSGRGPRYGARWMAEIPISVSPDGSAYVDLGGGKVRDSVELSGHEDADRIPTLDSLILHFDHYGRLTAIEVTDSVGSVLPPELIEDGVRSDPSR